jgi:LAO/AO transport system kinase
MEIADVFVVNKADREGKERVVAEIQSMLSMASHHARRPEIVETVASEDRGVDRLLEAVEAFRSDAEKSGALARKKQAQIEQQFREALQGRLMQRVRATALAEGQAERLLARLAAREVDPFTAADEVIARMGL